ncbi:MAG: hypothetical protein KKD01_19585, partial [Proteobacteria bacterium]|nr:hypothetical protein [Pseudomonadota bacterium]
AVKPIFKQQDDSLRVELIAVLMQSKEILSKIYFTISDLPSSCKGKDFILTETAINSLLNVAVDFQNIAKKCSTFEDKDNAEKSLESDIKEKRVKKEDIIKHLEENNFSEDQLEQMRGIFAPMLKSAESVKSGNTSTTTEGKETNTETEIVEENTETASDVKDEVIETLKSLQSGQKDIMERFEKQTNSTEQITKEFKELGDKFEITQKELNLIKETVEQIGKKTPTSKNIKGQELDHGKPEDKGTFSGVFFNGLK